jgi:hypothetical protein
MRYVDLSYDVPPTYGIDQYTGKTIITQEGYHVENRSIQFTIKNQQFTPYTDPNGTQIGLYYNFRAKGTYGTEWSYYPFAPNGGTTHRYGGWFGGDTSEYPEHLSQSNSEYTIITIAISSLLNDAPTGVQLEFQAQALIGYMEPTDFMMAGHVYVFTGESSDWSSTQTITIGESQTPTPSPATTSTPEQTPPPSPTNYTGVHLTEQEVIIIVAIAVAGIGASLGLLFYFKKRKKVAG